MAPHVPSVMDAMWRVQSKGSSLNPGESGCGAAALWRAAWRAANGELTLAFRVGAGLAGDRYGGYVCVEPGAIDASASTVAGKTGSYR